MFEKAPGVEQLEQHTVGISSSLLIKTNRKHDYKQFYSKKPDMFIPVFFPVMIVTCLDSVFYSYTHCSFVPLFHIFLSSQLLFQLFFTIIILVLLVFALWSSLGYREVLFVVASGVTQQQPDRQCATCQ